MENRTEKFWKALPPNIHRDELESLSSLGRERLYQMQRSGDIPPAIDGWYPFRESVTSLFRYYRTKASNRIEGADSKARQAAADAELSEVKLRKELLEFVDVVELANRMAAPLQAMKKLVTSNPKMDTDEKEEFLRDLQQLYGSIFGDKIVSVKLQKFLKENKLKL